MKSQQGNYLQRFGIAEQFKPTTHYRNTEVKCDGFTLGNTTQSSESLTRDPYCRRSNVSIMLFWDIKGEDDY